MWISGESWKKQETKKGCAIFETFSTDGPSKFLVVSRSRWDKHQRKWNAPWRQNSSASASDGWWQEGLEQQRVGWSSVERRVVEAVEDYLEHCANMKADIKALERAMEPENQEISLRYILKYSTRGGSTIFQLFDTSERQDHFVANRKRWLESEGKNVAQQESWQNEWHDIGYQRVMAKAPPCPERTLITPLSQQSSHSSREEEGQWVAMEDRRRRSIAFEKMAKRMLKNLEDSDDVKVGVTELQKQLEIRKKWVFPLGKLPSKQCVRTAKRFSNFIGKEKKRYVLLVWPDATRR